MAKITEADMGRIALKILKAELKGKQLPAPNDFGRMIGSAAKEIGETPQTLKDFYAAILPELIGKMFNSNSVSLEIGNMT